MYVYLSATVPSYRLTAQVTYLLLVECSHFLEHIGEAANLLPVLRGRICGYTGIYRSQQCVYYLIPQKKF